MIKLSSDYVMRNIAGETVIVPVGGMSQKLNGLITLNDTGLLIWKCLENGLEKEAIIAKMMEEYEVDRRIAQRDVEGFVNMLLENGFAKEEQ